MAPHNQSNTIDFDAAKLQRLGYAGRLQKNLKPVSLAQLRQQQGRRALRLCHRGQHELRVRQCGQCRHFLQACGQCA